MQRITYINLRGEQAAFGRGGPWLLRSVRGLGTCENELTLTSGGMENGARIQAFRREERIVTAQVQLLAESRADLYRRRVELCRLLSPDLGAQGAQRARLIYENDLGAWWTWAVPLGGLDWGARVGDIHTGLNVRFQCEIPGGLPLRLGSQVFHMRVVNEGSAFAPCVVTVEGSGETPAMENRSTGALLRMVAPLATGERLTINTDPAALSATLTHADGSGENAFGYLDPTSALSDFGLRPGENELVYLPAGDRSRSVIRVSWHDTFEGV